jgi:2-hydroxycyclohexanecarboxyl-CoA dehydrogenase
MRGLRGKTILVTGAARGIGRAIAGRLVEEGCAVGVLDLDATGASAAAAELREASGRACALACDLRDGAAVEQIVATCERELGPLFGLVNNAGWDRAGDFVDTDPAFWRQVIDVNLYGPLHATRAVLPGLLARGAGRVVSIASDAGRVGSSGEAVYSACKGGIIAFTRSLAREVARKGVSLNCVSPGPTDTQLLATIDPTGRLQQALARAIPMGRVGRPDDIPGAVAFLLSDDAAFITGQVLSISGGLTMV